jgi:hypothetical protein
MSSSPYKHNDGALCAIGITIFVLTFAIIAILTLCN